MLGLFVKSREGKGRGGLIEKFKKSMVFNELILCCL